MYDIINLVVIFLKFTLYWNNYATATANTNVDSFT